MNEEQLLEYKNLPFVKSEITLHDNILLLTMINKFISKSKIDERNKILNIAYNEISKDFANELELKIITK